MKLTIVAVSQRPPEWAQSAFDDYLKRMPPDWQIDVKTVKPADRQLGKTATQNMAIEAERIEAALKNTAGVRVALDERGKSLTTEAFLNFIQTQHDTHGGVIFIIGGADGLDADFKSSCPLKIQLSAMTLPHALVKVLLAEQIYRAYSIATGHPYHRS
ncbi:MAG: 23S rRNA (pseudouridine(1915)-N(3))-methyltransferase RlmH [Burkholderiaceae bacterium]|nr:23S rRNA (pseudouridine(1915)-N(3))-methyltransferase RlmH [Burkholderiaceae bacterium]MCD8518103.1 23S rRNA (pseudouridine(1915)-N(3))-methyltransferase RlmH [Burkholderiaceae bacterium]MCD8537350.1 23S rRNA (pseudouridine(1915)-N(3))-methyltransferase RlmH [Burkholderiaceae bacterium]